MPIKFLDERNPKALLSHSGKSKLAVQLGGSVADWSKAMLEREKINENQMIPGSLLGLGKTKLAVQCCVAVPK